MMHTGNKLIDTSVLIAFFNKNDDFHDKAVKTIAELNKPVTLIDPVINETLALLRKRIGKDTAHKASQVFYNSDLLSHYAPNLEECKQALKLFNQHKSKYSYTDCSLAILAKLHKSTVLGFDKHFTELGVTAQTD